MTEQDPTEQPPSIDVAWTQWLELCDSGRCSEEELGALENWAAPRLRHKLQGYGNALSALTPNPSGTAPSFLAFESYCFEYPRREVAINPGKCYKNRLKAINVGQGFEASRKDASFYFKAIARNIRAKEKCARQVTATDPEKDPDEFIDSLIPEMGEWRHGEAGTAEIEESARLSVATVFDAISPRQRFLYWALCHGLKASDPAVLERANCGSSVAYADIVAVEDMFAAQLSDWKGAGNESMEHLVSETFVCFFDRLTAWAASEKLDAADFKGKR